MDWAMKMAAQVKRPRASASPWWIGEVVSPEERESGPLIIKLGEYSLEADRLTVPAHIETLTAGQRVALVGNIPGNQNFLVAGVI